MHPYNLEYIYDTELFSWLLQNSSHCHTPHEVPSFSSCYNNRLHGIIGIDRQLLLEDKLNTGDFFGFSER